jgi:Leucine-rich repeat (LRR) protein
MLQQLLSVLANAFMPAECTELSLARRGITQLEGFERLPNLEVLWLNHNNLTALTHLDANSRLQQLYVHSNKLVTLKGSLPKLKFLTHLDLSCNKLKHLGKVLASLQKLRFLKELNLQV